MIRVRKSEQAPEELVKNGYGAEAVHRQLLADQDDKCYLCERHITTDYQVEHLLPQSVHPELVNEWKNLFEACSYCNQEKGNRYDGMASPDAYNVEDIIKQDINFIDREAVFTVTDDADPGIQQTVSLLRKIYNGDGLRTEKEQRFFDAFLADINAFQAAIDLYLDGNAEYSEVIAEHLDIHSEHLGF